MNAAIIILGIIFLIIIIIFLSLISYNMYKLSNINNEQQNIIKIIEDNSNKRFSNSIFMINAKNIFFRFNNYLINDIMKKLCISFDTSKYNNPIYYKECNNEKVDDERILNDKNLKYYDENIKNMWKIIITTIKKLETPFYHKYTDTEIDNMIKEKISLNKVIEGENDKLHTNYKINLIMNAGVQVLGIYKAIIFDMIEHITDDMELQMSLFNKFKYIIEGIIIAFLSENYEDIKLMLMSNATNEGNKDILLTKMEDIYAKYNEIDIEDQFSKSANRYYETPKFRNNITSGEEKIENTTQLLKKLNDDYRGDKMTINEWNRMYPTEDGVFHSEVPKDYPDNKITYIGVAPKKRNGEPIHEFRIYLSAKPENWKSPSAPIEGRSIVVKEKNLGERERMLMRKAPQDGELEAWKNRHNESRSFISEVFNLFTPSVMMAPALLA